MLNKFQRQQTFNHHRKIAALAAPLFPHIVDALVAAVEPIKTDRAALQQRGGFNAILDEVFPSQDAVREALGVNGNSVVGVYQLLEGRRGDIVNEAKMCLF